MEYPLYAKDGTKYFTYFMSHLYLIPAGIGMIIPVYKLGGRDLGDRITFWRSHSWIWTQRCLIVKPLPFPGFPLPPLLLLSHLPLGFSSYQDKELISRRKVAALKAASHGIKAGTCTLGQLGSEPIGIIYQLCDCEAVPGPHWASWYFIIKIRTIVSALQDNIMHNK